LEVRLNNYRSYINDMKFSIKNPASAFFVISLAALVIAGALIISTHEIKTTEIKTTEDKTAEVSRAAPAGKPPAEKSLVEKFSILSNAHTNYCAGIEILDNTAADRLQGSCCSPMDFHKYEEQVEGLKKYSYLDIVPSDPYDIPIGQARQLLAYRSIQLTPDQQKVYEEAMKLSPEGGPCCCKCWRWYAFEGQAKKLIVEYNFTAEEVAEVWGLEDGCGGEGHEHSGEVGT